MRAGRPGSESPEITEIQARAIFEAVVQVHKKGVRVIPEVMIPLIGSAAELAHQKNIVVKVAEEVLGNAGVKDEVKYRVPMPVWPPPRLPSPATARNVCARRKLVNPLVT